MSDAGDVGPVLPHPRDGRRALRLVWDASPGWTVVSAALVLVQGLLPLIGLVLLKSIIDEVESVVAAGGGVDDGGRALALVGAAAVVALVGSALGAASTWVTEVQGEDVADHVLDLVQTKSTEVDLSFFEDPTLADTLHRAQQAGGDQAVQVVRGLVGVAQASISLFAVGAFLLTFHWVVAPILVVSAVPVLAVRLQQARRRFDWERHHTTLARETSHLGWMMTGPQNAREIRLFDLGGFFRERFQERRRRLRQVRLDLAASRARAELIGQATSTVAMFGAFAFVTWRTLAGEFTIGDLAVFFTAFQRLQTSLQTILANTSLLYEHHLYLSNLFEFLDLTPTIGVADPPAATPGRLRDGIALRSVGFTYPGTTRPVLRDVDLTIAAGEVVALVGPNGSGKSTIVKLLCRFYDPTSGSISFDGVDVRHVEPAVHRARISVIFQDYLWYHLLTARENIALGRATMAPDDELVARAAELSGAAEFIEALPDGYDTMMGRMFGDGVELSIGQWQRLALARSLYRDADLLVLDEPSSALDPRAEAEVFERFAGIARQQTTILVSHRLANVRHADRIVVIDEGRIVEQGRHDELMERHGAYRALFDLQARHYR